MLKKLVSIAALVALMALGGCAQGQASHSAETSSESVASAPTAEQRTESSSASAEQLAGGSSASAEQLAGGSSASAERSEEAPTESSGATLGAEASSNSGGSDAQSSASFTIGVDGTQLEVELADTDAARALVEQLQAGSVTVSLHAYGGFEKVGPLPWPLPANDVQFTTRPGDVMLYQGNQITIFTGSNSWAYTPLGHIEGATSESLLEVLGDGDVEAVLSLA